MARRILPQCTSTHCPGIPIGRQQSSRSQISVETVAPMSSPLFKAVWVAAVFNANKKSTDDRGNTANACQCEAGVQQLVADPQMRGGP